MVVSEHDNQVLEALAVLGLCGGSLPARVAGGVLERVGLWDTWCDWTTDEAPEGVMLDDDLVVLQPQAAASARLSAAARDADWVRDVLWAVVETVECVGSEMRGGELLGALLAGARAARRLCEVDERTSEPFLAWTLTAGVLLLQDSQYEAAREVLVAASERAQHFPFDTKYMTARLDWEIAQLDAEEALLRRRDPLADAALIVACAAGEEAALRLERFSESPEEPVLAWCCLADVLHESGDLRRALLVLDRAEGLLRQRWTQTGEQAVLDLRRSLNGHLTDN